MHPSLALISRKHSVRFVCRGIIHQKYNGKAWGGVGEPIKTAFAKSPRQKRRAYLSRYRGGEGGKGTRRVCGYEGRAEGFSTVDGRDEGIINGNRGAGIYRVSGGGHCLAFNWVSSRRNKSGRMLDADEKFTRNNTVQDNPRNNIVP